MIIALIIAYQWYAESTQTNTPTVVSRPGVNSTTDFPASGSASATLEGRYLRNGQGDNLVSPAGWIYTPGKSGHRSKPVLRHERDEPEPDDPLGVFDVQGNDVFRLIDEAYELIQDQVNSRSSLNHRGDRITQTVKIPIIDTRHVDPSTPQNVNGMLVFQSFNLLRG